MLEVYVDGSSKPVKFRMAQSSETLNDTEEEEREEGQTTPQVQKKVRQFKVYFSAQIICLLHASAVCCKLCKFIFLYIIPPSDCLNAISTQPFLFTQQELFFSK